MSDKKSIALSETDANPSHPSRIHGGAWSRDQMTRQLRMMFGGRRFRAPNIALMLGAPGQKGYHLAIRAVSVEEAVSRICDVPSDRLGEGVCVATSPCGSRNLHTRGNENTVAGQVGVMVEIDIHPSGLKDGKPNGKRVPRTRDDAYAVLASLPITPTMIIGSGSDGIHAYYLFDTPEFFGESTHVADRAAAKNRQYGWWATVSAAFVEAGYGQLDATHDISRILRLAGTRNGKYTDERWAEIISDDGPRHGVHELDLFATAPPSKPANTNADAGDFFTVDTPSDAMITDDTREKINTVKRLAMLWRQDPSVAPKDTPDETEDTSQSWWDFEISKELMRNGVRNRDELWAVLARYRREHCTDEDKILKGLSPYYAERTIRLAESMCPRPEDDFGILPVADGEIPASESAGRSDRDSAIADILGAKMAIPTKLLRIITLMQWDYWTSSTDAEPWVSYRVHGHIEHHRIRSTPVRQHITSVWWRYTETAISGDARGQVVDVMEAMARHNGRSHPTPIRVGCGDDAALYVDLLADDWSAVRIADGRWEIVANPPIRFRRVSGALPLPVPTHGGDLHRLRKYIRTADESQYHLIAAWLVGCYLPAGPYPILTFAGEMGSGKSTTMRQLRGLVDPHRLISRTQPRDEHDLHIGAGSSYVMAFDNLSGLPGWLSDAMCRLSTGGGMSTRKLYTDDDEIIFDAKRPQLIGAICDVVTRSDLQDRTLTVRLGRIAPGDRLTESELDEAYRDDAPSIMGGLLDAVAVAHRDHRTISVPLESRLADWYRWAAAACPALGWPVDALSAAVGRVARYGRANVIEASREVQAIVTMLRRTQKREWTGTASELSAELASCWGDHRTQPPRPNTLAGRLAELMPVLTEDGWGVARTEQRGRGIWLISLPEAMHGVDANGDKSTVENFYS